MRTIERARWLLSRDPHGPSVRVLQKLLHALETGGDFNIAELACLPNDRYELALDVLRDWRKDRYHLAVVNPVVPRQCSAEPALQNGKALAPEPVPA